MADLKKLPAYSRFDALLSMGTDYAGIDAVVEKYLRLYEKIAARPAENALGICVFPTSCTAGKQICLS